MVCVFVGGLWCGAASDYCVVFGESIGKIKEVEMNFYKDLCFFEVGSSGIGLIRPSNKGCVDIFSKGKRKDWFCIEHVLKHPEFFKPIFMCKIGTKPFYNKKIGTCEAKVGLVQRINCF